MNKKERWRLKIRILRTGLRQKQFSKKAKVSATTLSLILNGHVDPRKDTAIKINNTLTKLENKNVITK